MLLFFILICLVYKSSIVDIIGIIIILVYGIKIYGENINEKEVK